VLVADISHFLELKVELEVRGSRRNANLIEDEAHSLLTQVCAASDLLALHVPSSIVGNPLDDMGE
jgi:hypothetical protein